MKYYGEGKAYTNRWADLFTTTKEDDRTGDEIAMDVISNLGLSIKEK